MAPLDPIRLRGVNYGSGAPNPTMLNAPFAQPTSGWQLPQTAAQMLDPTGGIPGAPSVRFAPTNVVPSSGAPIPMGAAQPAPAALNFTPQPAGPMVPGASPAASGAQNLAASLPGGAGVDPYAPGTAWQQAQLANSSSASPAANAAKTGKFAGARNFMAGNPFLAAGEAPAGAFTRGALLPGGGAGSVAAGLGWGAAGYAGSKVADSFNVGGQDSVADRALSDAVMGAGIGAAGGSVVPIIGTGLGALTGGLIGGAWGALHGKDPQARYNSAMDSNQKKLMDAIKGVSDMGIRQQILGEWQAFSSSPTKTDAAGNVTAVKMGPDAVKALNNKTAELVNRVPTLTADQAAIDKQQQTEMMNQMAFQALAGTVLQPHIQRMNDTAELEAEGYEAAAAQAGGKTADIYLRRAAETRHNAATNAMAFAMQGQYGAQNQNVSNYYKQQQALANQVAQQAQQHGVTTMLGGGASAGAGSAGAAVDKVMAGK